ncbi:bifunctional lysylphosphatidylglycerol flippase/synthetase MprF [Microbacterium sp. ASV49]
MTDAVPRTANRVIAVLRRTPGTIAMIAAILIVGVVSQGLWHPFRKSPWWGTFAYGLPAFEAGRWWTPFTGTFLVAFPWIYVIVIIGFAGMAFLEFRRGWRVALSYFWVGQLFAIFAAALLLWILRFTPWEWAQDQAARIDVGPGGGVMACIAAAIGLFKAPWRVRGWALLLAWLFVAMLFWGNVLDLEHLLGVLLVLAFDRSLRLRRTTVREQRLLAFLGLITLGAIEIIVLIVPTDGLFGPTAPVSGSAIDILTDVVIIGLAANGLRRGRRWAWIVSIALALVNILSMALLILLIALEGWVEMKDLLRGDPSVSLATGVLWILAFVYLILVRGAFRVRRRSRVGAHTEPTVDDVKAEIHTYGGGTLSWMATWDGNSYLRTSTGIVAYQKRSGVAIALGDPLGPSSGVARSTREFIEAVEHQALIPCFFSATAPTKAAVPRGWRSLVVADDTIVDLPGLEFTGKRWNNIRTALNRAEREGVTFRLTHLKDEPWGVQQQLRAISEMWVGDRGLPEMSFTLGTLDEAEDPEVRLALAVSENGDVEGFLSWLPRYAPGGEVYGWTLDLMRRREGGFQTVMEFLLGSSVRAFRDEGAQVASLSGAPLTHEGPREPGIIGDLTERLATALEPVYGFQALHRFKQKFHPRYDRMYLLYRDEGDLAGIATGLTRAFLPDATLRQFAGAGLDLVRRD